MALVRDERAGTISKDELEQMLSRMQTGASEAVQSLTGKSTPYEFGDISRAVVARLRRWIVRGGLPTEQHQSAGGFRCAPALHYRAWNSRHPSA